MKQNYTFEEILKQIEFPGEDEKIITAYLEGMDFTARVMDAVYAEKQKASRVIPWVIFALGNLGLMIFLGTNSFILENTISTGLGTFLFLFPTITLFGSLTGLILTMDTSSLIEKISGWLRKAQIPGF